MSYAAAIFIGLIGPLACVFAVWEGSPQVLFALVPMSVVFGAMAVGLFKHIRWVDRHE